MGSVGLKTRNVRGFVPKIVQICIVYYSVIGSSTQYSTKIVNK
jgi:hypothetical protein